MYKVVLSARKFRRIFRVSVGHVRIFFISVSPEINMHNYWRVSAVVISYENTYTNPYFPLPSPYFPLPSPYHPLLSSTIPLPSLYHPSTVPLPSLYHPSTTTTLPLPSLYRPSTVPLPPSTTLYHPLPSLYHPSAISMYKDDTLRRIAASSHAKMSDGDTICISILKSICCYWRVSAV